MHVRRRLVLAVVAALRPLAEAGLATSVSPGRAAPQPVERAPYLLVYARSEQARGSAMDDARSLERAVTVAVEAVFASADDSDAMGDDLALSIETAMAGDPTFGGLVMDSELMRTDLDARAEGETRLGRVRLEYTVTYHTPAARPDISLN